MSERHRGPETLARQEGFTVGERVFLPLSNGTVDSAIIEAFEASITGDVLTIKAVLRVEQKPNVFPKIDVRELRRIQDEYRKTNEKPIDMTDSN